MSDIHDQLLSYVQLFVTPWNIASQASLSMRFPKQEYWSGLPFPSAWYLPDSGMQHESPVAPILAGGFLTTESPEKPIYIHGNSFPK